jgi:hypothetical protein
LLVEEGSRFVTAAEWDRSGAGLVALAAAVPSPGGTILSKESPSCGEEDGSPVAVGADSPMGEMNPCLSNIPKSIEAEAGRAEQEKQPSVEDWERPTSVATGGGMSNPDRHLSR